MAKGTTYSSERRIFTDDDTGAALVRLSGFPTLNYHVYMHSRCFTPDSRDAVFYSQRQLTRDSPRDIFAVSVDGLHLRQLTDSDGIGWMTCSPRERSVYFARGNAIMAVDVDSFEEKLIAELPGGAGIISLSNDSKKFLSFSNHGGSGSITSTNTKSGSTEVIYEHPDPVGHLQLEPARSRHAIFHDRNPGRGTPRLWVVGVDGSDPHMLYDGSMGDPSHFVWLPGEDAIISTLQPRTQGIIRIGLGGDLERIASGQHYWHPGARYDGRMVCSDTFIPDNGLYLVDPDNGAEERLCLSRSSNSHPQWTHPHPTWSPDGSMVLFTSDMEGISNVYVVQAGRGD
jgi:Tol biopolymer transport system component